MKNANTRTRGVLFNWHGIDSDQSEWDGALINGKTCISPYLYTIRSETCEQDLWVRNCLTEKLGEFTKVATKFSQNLLLTFSSYSSE